MMLLEGNLFNTKKNRLKKPHRIKNRQGIDVYVLDTGVYIDHLDFDGRASHAINLIQYEDENDMGGHGKKNRLREPLVSY